jgi:hypothetical protein
MTEASVGFACFSAVAGIMALVWAILSLKAWLVASSREA